MLNINQELCPYPTVNKVNKIKSRETANQGCYCIESNRTFHLLNECEVPQITVEIKNKGRTKSYEVELTMTTSFTVSPIELKHSGCPRQS